MYSLEVSAEVGTLYFLSVHYTFKVLEPKRCFLFSVHFCIYYISVVLLFCVWPASCSILLELKYNNLKKVNGGCLDTLFSMFTKDICIFVSRRKSAHLWGLQRKYVFILFCRKESDNYYADIIII